MDTFLTFLFWIIVVAIIMSLTRPGSVGGKAIIAVTSAFALAVGSATGYNGA
jgi:lipopolysaccharide export LptBFGC system permease protein LptF